MRVRLEQAVTAWSDKWFAGRRLSLMGYRVITGDGASVDPLGWRLYGSRVALRSPRPATTRLLGWMFDAELEMLELTDADWSFVDGMEHRLMGDLALHLEGALGGVIGAPRAVPERLDAPMTAQGGVMIEIAEEQGPALATAAIPLAAILPLARTTLPPVDHGTPAYATLQAALGSTPVEVAASLGGAEILLTDLRRLAPGDVLVLDRTLTDPALLTAAGASTPFARGAMGDADGFVALTLHS